MVYKLIWRDVTSWNPLCLYNRMLMVPVLCISSSLANQSCCSIGKNRVMTRGQTSIPRPEREQLLCIHKKKNWQVATNQNLQFEIECRFNFWETEHEVLLVPKKPTSFITVSQIENHEFVTILKKMPGENRCGHLEKRFSVPWSSVRQFDDFSWSWWASKVALVRVAQGRSHFWVSKRE